MAVCSHTHMSWLCVRGAPLLIGDSQADAEPYKSGPGNR